MQKIDRKLKEQVHTFTIREKLDEPAVQADAIRGSEPDIFILEAEPGGCDGVAAGETRYDRHIDKLFLKGNQKHKASAGKPSNAIQEPIQEVHHFCFNVQPTFCVRSVPKLG